MRHLVAGALAALAALAAGALGAHDGALGAHDGARLWAVGRYVPMLPTVEAAPLPRPAALLLLLAPLLLRGEAFGAAGGWVEPFLGIPDEGRNQTQSDAIRRNQWVGG